MLCILLLSKWLDLAFSYRPVLIFMSLGCCLLPFVARSGNVAWLLTMAGYFCFEIMNWVILSDTSFRFNMPAYRVCGFGRAAISGGVFLGAALGMYLNQHMTFTSEMSTALSFAMVFMMTVTYTFTLTERDVAKITRRRMRLPKAIGGADPTGSNESRPLSIGEKVQVVAKEYDISGRGLGVFALIAKGRSRPRIEQELYMSRGAVTRICGVCARSSMSIPVKTS